MNNEPISIIIPVYNVESFIELSINSILKQLPTNSEIVAIDDASTDASLSCLYNLAHGESRLRVIALHENIGQGAVRNLGISESRHELILFVDSDDLLPDNAITGLSGQ
ncbi:MAG: glycosyltransferase family 2 protein [Melioribacteraceae bacterium]|nr:glycosyltransferase family 2 protein [Melioribacteraceae bacterium]